MAMDEESQICLAFSQSFLMYLNFVTFLVSMFCPFSLNGQGVVIISLLILLTNYDSNFFSKDLISDSVPGQENNNVKIYV